MNRVRWRMEEEEWRQEYNELKSNMDGLRKEIVKHMEGEEGKTMRMWQRKKKERKRKERRKKMRKKKLWWENDTININRIRIGKSEKDSANMNEGMQTEEQRKIHLPGTGRGENLD